MQKQISSLQNNDVLRLGLQCKPRGSQPTDLKIQLASPVNGTRLEKPRRRPLVVRPHGTTSYRPRGSLVGGKKSWFRLSAEQALRKDSVQVAFGRRPQETQLRGGAGPETGRETQGIVPAALRGAGRASGLRTVPRPCCPAWAVRMIAGWQAGRLSSGAQSAAILVSVFLVYKKADTWAKQRRPVQASSTRATQTSGSDWASPRETGPRGALGAYSGRNPVGFTPP